MTKHAPKEGARKQTQALEFLQPRDIRQSLTQLIGPAYLTKHKWQLEVDHSPGGFLVACSCTLGDDHAPGCKLLNETSVHGVSVVGDDVNILPELLQPHRVFKLRIPTNPRHRNVLPIHEELDSPQLLLDVLGQVQRPLEGGKVELIAALPGHDGGVLLVAQARVRVQVVEDCCYICPEVFLNLSKQNLAYWNIRVTCVFV